MILAYTLFPEPEDGTMLDGPHFTPAEPGEFYDWRFGQEGRPHPATCGRCGRIADPAYVGPTFRVKRRRLHIGTTYDGYYVASRRFRRFCQELALPGLEFAPLPSDDAFHVLRLTRILPFDAERSGTRFENPCSSCGRFHDVVGISPPHLRGVTGPIADGLYRTDLEFGSGHEQQPLIVAGLETYQQLRSAGLGKFGAEAVEG